jgi:hypothetical protein
MTTRDKDFIRKNLYIKDGKIYTKEKTIIEFPKWYEDKELLDIKEVTYLYGIFAIIIGDKYSVSVIPTLVNTTPIVVKEVEREGITYVQFIYGKDDCLIDNTNVIKKDLLSYNLFENFFIYAKIPWFIEYEDLIRITDNIFKYSKSNLGNNFIATELVTSFIARNSKNKSMFFRQEPKGDVEYVDLTNPYYSSISTLAKISGNYFTESLTSAIVQKEKEPTKLENLVRR